MSELLFKEFCTFEKNPFILLMFAELSTPFLMIWRYTQNEIIGGLFVITFFGCRILYHGFVLIPQCMSKCHWSVGYGFGVPYDLMNVYFLWMIVRRFIFKPKKLKDSNTNSQQKGSTSLKGN